MDDLRSDLGLGTLAESGEQIDPGELRRLACDASVLPVVLGSNSAPLDVGREQRVVPAELRQALVVRDRGCVFPGCDRPPSDCEAHHLIPWIRDGLTCLLNLALLCPHHHRLVEPHRRSVPGSRWEVRMGSDGLVDVIPPVHVDPERKPLRHGRFGVEAFIRAKGRRLVA